MKLLLAARMDDAERHAWLAALRAALPDDELVELGRGDAGGAEVALVAHPPRGALAGMPDLRLVQSLWAGVDRVLADDTLPAGVPLARMVDPAMTEAMMQTALWAVLALHRGFFRYQAQQRAGLWQPSPQRRADEVAVAVLGFGELGRACAQALAGLGYRVAVWSRRGNTGPWPADPRITCHAGGPDGLDALLSTSHVLVNLLPLTPETRGLLDARRLSRLPRGAGLVNLARGAHVVENDLLDALDTGHLAHAVLDVFDREPLPAGHRFWSHPGVTVLPHVAALTDPRSAAQVVARNVSALKRGAPIAHLVDRRRGY